MTNDEHTQWFFNAIHEFCERKKANPYFAVNYRKPLKTKRILQRLKKPLQ